MEKVIIMRNPGITTLFGDDAEQVNKLLDKGWTVKSVTMSSTHDDTTAIIVIENQC